MSRPEKRPLHWWLGVVLGTLLVVAGIGETVRLTRSGDGGLWFWFPTLVGGGALILVGTLLVARKPMPGLFLVLIGCLLGFLPTVWTLILPVLLVALAIVTAKHVAAITQQE